MCGILGGFWRSPPEDVDSRTRLAMKAIAHRGPDDEGTVFFKRKDSLLMLGHTRLSIIDLSSSGHQPMISRNGRFTLVFNGEIYNYRELRQELAQMGAHFISDSDTEVLLEAWALLGESCIPRLVGMFAFAIYDEAEDTLTMVRDAFGIKPLFYAHDVQTSSFLLASEVGALLPLRGGQPVVNWQRAYDYLEHGLQDAPNGTFIQGINHLPPAHLLRLNLKTLQIQNKGAWWQPRFEQTSVLSFKDASERLRELFLANIRLHLRSDVPVGAALSGGIDSSAIVCAMRLLEPNMPIHTFSYVAKDTPFNEEIWIDLVNRHVGAISHKVHVRPEEVGDDFADLICTQGEPFNSTSMYAQYRVFKEARAQGVPVILEGQGADELLAGYEGYPGQRMKSLLESSEWRKLIEFARAWRRIPGRKRSPWRALAGQMLPESLHARLQNFRSGGKVSNFLDYSQIKARGVAIKTPWMGRTRTGHGRRVAEVLAYSLSGHELPTLLRFGDRNAMRFSIENRVPFLTTEMAEFLLSLPENYLISDAGETKRIFRAAMQDIVPREILERQDKIGFVTPMQQWIVSRSALGLGKVLFEDSQPVIKMAALRAEFEGLANGRRKLTYEMWRVINFIHWAKSFGVNIG